MSTKLLNDVAGILAEVGITYQQAGDIATILTPFFDDVRDGVDWIDVASNAPTGGECSC